MHVAATTFLRGCTARRRAIFCRATEQGFLRLLTTDALQRTYVQRRITNADALSTLHALVKLPQVGVVDAEPHGVRKRWHALAALPASAPHVWMDAWLAAWAITSERTLVTGDRDFLKWEADGLRVMLIKP